MPVPGLAIGSDMDPTCRDIGYIILSSSKKADVDQTSITEDVFKWFHENEALPFMRKVRESRNENSKNIHDTATFTLDSDIPYLKYLNRIEVRDDHEKARIAIVKVAAAGTHCYQYNDLSQCFKLASANFKDLSNKNSTTSLKTTITNLLRNNSFIKIRNKKLQHIIDNASVAPQAFQKSFNTKLIQEGYILAGALSKLPDGQVTILPNIKQMVSQCKASINWKQEYYEQFISKIPVCIQKLMDTGYIPDSFLLEQGLKSDNNMEGIEVMKCVTMNQIWLQRSVIYSHSQWRQLAEDNIRNEISQKQDQVDNKYKIANVQVKTNERIECLFREKFSIPLLEDIPGNVSQENISRFFKSTDGVKLKHELFAFVRVRIQKDLLDDIPHELNKITVAQLRTKAESLIHMQRLAADPGPPPKLTYNPIIPASLAISSTMSSAFKIEIDENMINNIFASFESIKKMGKKYKTEMLSSLNYLQNNHLAVVLTKRLSRNLSGRDVKRLDHPAFQFFRQNSELAALLAKCSGAVINDNQLPNKIDSDCILSARFYKELVQYVDDFNGDWNGCYMYEDVLNEGFIRAGSMGRKRWFQTKT